MIETHGIEVDLQITNQCPLRCKHCVYDSSLDEGPGLPRHLIERLCDEFEDLAVTQVSITGGEPFIRTDLIEIISAISARRIETCVQTSGLFADRIDFGALRASGLDILLVSIDGPPEYHDKFRQRPGTFADARRTVLSARDHGIPVRINTVVTRSNAGSVPVLLPMAENDGVDVFSFFYFSPLGRGARNSGEALRVFRVAAFRGRDKELAGKAQRGPNENQTSIRCRRFGISPGFQPALQNKGPKQHPHSCGRRRLPVCLRLPLPGPLPWERLLSSCYGNLEGVRCLDQPLFPVFRNRWRNGLRRCRA